MTPPLTVIQVAKRRETNQSGFVSRLLMRMVGLEPTRGHPRKILSLVRLPFRHIRMRDRDFSPSRHSLYYHVLLLLSNTFFPNDDPHAKPKKNRTTFVLRTRVLRQISIF